MPDTVPTTGSTTQAPSTVSASPMASLQLPALPPFSLADSSTLGQRWSKWVQSLEYFVVASGITDSKQKRAVLLHVAGPEVQDIFATLQETGEDYAAALAKLTAYFEPKKNVSFERHIFRSAVQMPDEPLDAFATRLRQLVQTCDHGERANEMIRDQLVNKCHSRDLRRRFLREKELTLENALSIARAIEASNRNAAQMETQAPVAVNSLRFRSDRPKTSKPPRKANSRSTNNALRRHSSTPICFCCGNEGHKAKHPSCPATGATCSHCGKKGHFQRVCNGKRSAQAGRERREGIRLVVTEDDSPDDSIEDEYLFVLENSASQRTVPVRIHGVYTPVIIDSGASVNVLDSQAFHRFRDVSLLKTDLRVFPYGSPTPVPVKGTFDTRVSSDSTGLSTVARFVVVENETAGSLLGKDTAISLGLLRVGPVEPVEVRSVAHGLPGTDVPARSPRVDQLVTQYASIFEGVGKLKNYQLKIHTDPTVTPVAQPLRRTPFHIRKDVEHKLQQLADLDIIEDAEGPTPWVSPLVAVPKSSGEIRVCVDMRRVNEAVVCERHPIPTLEETLQAMNGAKVFSKLDLRWGYHQIELHPDSRALTTFSTHTGLKRYKRLIFGLSSASEQYQYVIQETLQGIAGTRNISDDIIIFGKDQESHDRSLEETFKRLKECGLTLNKEKCLFSVSELVFFGFKVSAAGLSPDDKKVEAIQNARTPLVNPLSCQLLFQIYSRFLHPVRSAPTTDQKGRPVVLDRATPRIV